MSKRVQKNLQAELDKVGSFIESTVETHMGMFYILYVGSVRGSSITSIIWPPILEYVKENQQRNKIGLVFGAIPHIVALLFPAVIVWIAKPSSCKFFFTLNFRACSS